MCIGRIVATLVAVPLAAGCTVVVGGTVRPAPGMTPRPLIGQAVKQVLLGQAQLSTLLDQSFHSDPLRPPVLVGGSALDRLVDMDASPRECAGVVFELQKSSYRPAGVQDVEQESWWNSSRYDAHPAVIRVHDGVVAVPAAKEADTLFAQFSQQWQRCDGTTVTSNSTSGEQFSTSAVTDVRAADSVLAATVRTNLDRSATGGPVMYGRALGVRVNCLVEVDVAFFSGHSDTTAVDIAHRMMDKVSDLS